MSEKDWNTAAYKLGVGVVNTAEFAASIAIGGKIGGTIPKGTASVPKASVFSRIGNAIDNFGTPALATTNGMVISGAVPLEETLAASTYSTAGGIINSSLAGSNIYYSGKGSGQANKSTGKGNKKADYAVSSNGVVESLGTGQHVLERHVGKSDAELFKRLNDNPKISGVSTFIDDVSANTVIKNALQDSSNINKINRWLNKGGKGNLPLQYSGNDIIGRGASRGTNTVQNMTNAKIILKNNGTGGYDILTAYPSK